MGYFSCRRESAVLSYPQTATTKLELRIFRYEELESATSGFSPSAFLGRGSHGSVFLASLDGGRLLTAAKVPSPPLPDDNPTTTTTDNEIEILSSLTRRSTRLVNLLGYTPPNLTTPRIAVVELMPGGTLHDLLHSPRPLPWRRRLRLALHAAEAVAVLHALRPPVVHRDIKPSNVLIDGAGAARLGDLGLAVRLTATAAAAAAPAGTMGYIDPGYVTPADVSTKSDVYSFGVLLLEIVSGRRAIDVDYSPPSLVDWAAPLIEAGRIAELWDPRAGPLLVERSVERELAVLARRCVAQEAERRPCMTEVVGCLRSVGRRFRSPSPVTWRLLARRVGGGNSSRNQKVSDVGT